PLTTRDPRRMLEHEEVDMAVGYFPALVASLAARGQSGDSVLAFETQRLYVGEYVCVMRRDHPLAAAPLTLDAFCAARHMLVSFSGRPYGFIDQTLGALGRRRHIVITVNQFFTAERVVANSDLLTVLPRHFVSEAGVGTQLVLRDLPFDQPMVHVDAVWHRRAQRSRANEWLRSALLRSAEEAFSSARTGRTPDRDPPRGSGSDFSERR
ncbi:MAG: LysR family transcriptional regulator, partial [Gammaproteobacteria bacterium]|nr:LysR family transcriptional regulator [Gammaproteobacteria bacterium]